MDLKQSLVELETTLEWTALAEALEQASEQEQDVAAKVQYLLRLGRLLNGQLMQGARALRFFQNAWKLQPESVAPLLEARDVYLGLGRIKMVETVLRRSLESATSELRGKIQLDLGDALQDLGNYEAADESYQGAADSDDTSFDALLAIEDLSVDDGGFQSRIDELLAESIDQADSDSRVRLILRAARIAKRFAAADQYEELLLSAYQSNPAHAGAAALYEGLFLEGSEGTATAAGERGDMLVKRQRELVAEASPKDAARLAFVFGSRWAQHQDVVRGRDFLGDALTRDPSNAAAYVYLREQVGTVEGDWGQVMDLLEGASERSGASCAEFVLAEAGKTAWLHLGDVMRARRWFERLSLTAPQHPGLASFELQLGAPVRAAELMADTDDSPGSIGAPSPSLAEEVALAEVVEESAIESADSYDEMGDSFEEVADADVAGAVVPDVSQNIVEEMTAESALDASIAEVESSPTSVEPASVAAVSVAAVSVAAVSVAAVPVAAVASAAAPTAVAQLESVDSRDSTVEDAALIAKLLDEADKQQKAKRSHDYVKTLVKLGEAYLDTEKKVASFSEAADIYQKFSNASEAAKCFEQILATDGSNMGARNFLREYYEKRRDWEKLVELMRTEADGLPTGARAARYAEMAQLATEKIKKPQLCIDLWTMVRGFDPGNIAALEALATFHERAREFEALASVLIELVDALNDPKEQLVQLQKLAQIQGDRLNDDAGAAAAWKRVLDLAPDDRRAQENLKKRLLTLQQWDALEELYEESGKWDELIRSLETQEQKEKDDPAKIGLLAKIADLWLRKKEKGDRAAKAYEKVLSLDENHLVAAEALIPIYRAAANPKGLAQVVEVKLLHSTEADVQVPLLNELGDLYETKLKAPELALERYLLAFALSTDLVAADSAERVARASGAWEGLIAAYRSTLESLLDPEREASLRVRLGRVLLDENKNVDGALVQYRAVYELDPNNSIALEALERLYRETKRHSDLLEVYEKQRELADSPEAQCRVLFGIASMQELELGQPERAVDTYLQILDILPADGRALEALDRLYLAGSEWPEYADILRRRLEGDVDEADLLDLKYRLGQTLEHHLDDAASALECYRESLLVEPEDVRARAALEGLLANEKLRAEVALVLVDVYEGRQDWPALVGALEVLVESTTTPAERVVLLRRIAGVTCHRLSDASRAFAAGSRALAEEPENDDVRAELESFAEQSENWSGLATVYAGIASGIVDAGLAARYWTRLAEIQGRLGHVDAAAQSYGKILDGDPADSAALDALELLFVQSGRHHDVIGVVRRRLDLAQADAVREGLLAKIGAIYDGKLDKTEEAITAYVEILGFDDRSRVALRALDELYERESLFQELAQNLEQQMRVAETEDEEIALMLRLGTVQESKLGLVPAAIETYRVVLERQPNHASAMAALEALGRRPEYELEIAETLGSIYRATGNHQKLVGIFEVQIRRAEDPARAVELLHEMAQLHEDAASNPSGAFDTLVRALAFEPGSALTQEGLQRLAGATGRFADLARVYEEQARALSDKELAISLYVISASLQRDELGAVDAAVALYRRILELDATHVGAVEALERLFQQNERYDEYSQALQLRASLVADVEQQKSALMEAAAIEEEVLGHVDSSIAVYRKVLAIDAEDLRAIDALIRLFLGLQRWQELLAVYAKKAELIYEPEERKRLYYQAGAVYERELGDVGNAIGTYQRVLELDPDDIEALGRLDALYQEAQDWPELLNVLQRQADLAADPVEAVSYQYRIAELYDRKLDEVARAIELYRELLSQQPDHAPTLAALEVLTKGDRDPIGAAQALEPVYQAMGDSRRLIAVLEVQVAKSEDVFARVEMLTRIASFYEEALNDPGSAFDTYARAISIDSGNEALLAEYERLAAYAGRWVELASIYDRQLTALPSSEPAPVIELALRLARIYEEQLEDWDASIARYASVLALDSENAVAIDSLDRLYEQTERWPELASILGRLATVATDGGTGARFRLAQVQQYRLGDVAGAIATYGQVLADEPGHEGAISALEALFNAGQHQLAIAPLLEPHYDSVGQYDYLGGVYEAVLAHKVDPAERLEQYHRIAELQEQRLAIPGAALSAYVRALGESPSDGRVLQELERLAALVEDGWEHVANAYADVLSQEVGSQVQQLVGKRLARVFEEELQDLEKAEETYAYVLSVAALDIDCLENLDRIYSLTGHAAALAPVLEQRVATVDDAFAKVELLLRLGEIYEQVLAAAEPRFQEDAIRVYRRVLEEFDPQNETAQVVLERLYGQQGRWQELYGVYERQLTAAVGDYEQGEISAKMARVLTGGLGDSRRAIETWQRVLEFKGEDSEALAALSSLFEETFQWAELTEILERHLSTVVDEAEHVAVLLRRARLHSQQLRRDDMAIEDYSRALEIDFANLEALFAIADIARRRYTGELPHDSRGDATNLLAALHQIADRAAQVLPAEHLLALYRELGSLHHLNQDQRFDAIDAWRHLLAVDPRDFDAMAKLEVLLRAEDAWRDVAEVRLMRARAYADPADKLREYLEVAQVWEHRVGDPDGATLALEAVLELDPANDDAFVQLGKLHKVAARWEALIELYVARVETRDDVHERTALLRKVARVFQEQLLDLGQAYDSLETAFTLDISDDETVAYLEKITAETRRWGALIQTGNTLLEEATDPRLQVALCLRLAKWYGDDLDRQDYAQPFYARVQQLEPNNVQVRRQSASFLRKQGDWRAAGQRLEEALAFATRDAERAAILADIGDLLEKYAGQPEQGFARYLRAVEVDPTCLAALDALERIYEARNQQTELVGVLERKLKAVKDPERGSEIRMRIGAMLEGPLAHPERAIALYRGVLEQDAANILAIRGLERVYTATVRWPEMLEVLEMHLDVASTERERADVLSQIAALQEEEFRKPELAAIRLEQVIEIDPTNLGAFDALARCYQKQQQWHELITCLDRFVQMVDDRPRKIQLLMWQGQVLSGQLQDHERAMDAYLAIIELDPQHIAALESLAKLYDRLDDSANAIEFMTRVAELTSDGSQRVEAFYRIGKQLEEKLGDRTQARARFEQALDLNPYHLATLGAMRAIAVDEADWYSATRYLETEQQHTESPRLRAKLLVELGRIRSDMMGQVDAGLQAYQLAQQSDPDNDDAALPLARYYVERGMFAEAEPLTDLLEKRAGNKDREQQLELLLLHGRVELELRKGQEALRAFAAAHKADLTNRDAIRGLGDANLILGDWAGALTNYQKVLTALSDDEGSLRAEILFRLGCVKREQGQAKQAINNFEKALQLEPSHRPTLEALAAIHASLNDWAQSCAYRQLVVDTVLDGEERFKMFLELSEAWDTKVGDAVQALVAMEQAVGLKPEDHQLQHRLLALYQKTARWHEVVQTLQRISEGDSNPQRRARYAFTMAQVYRDKLEDPYQAVDLFEQALDLHPEFVDAFMRVDKILTSIGDFTRLERSYRKMIHRVAGKGNAELEYNLWHSLGLIYRDRLQDFTKAAEAFSGAVAIKPDAVEERVILAELAVHTGDAGRALEQYRTMLESDPLNVDAYRAIYTIYLQQQSYDQAWCVASVLAFIGRANEEELRFFEDWRPQDVAQLSGTLDGALWSQHLFHKDEDLHIGKIFEAVAPAALKAKIADLTAKNQRPVLADNLRQDPATATGALPRSFWWAAKALGLQAPQLYARPEQPGLLTAVPSLPLASVAGQSALQGLSGLERAFVCGKHLAMYRGEHIIKTLFPTVTELTVLLFGSVRLVAQLPAPPEYAVQVQATTNVLGQYIEPIQREALKVAVGEFMKAGARANIKRWAQAVETTAARAGLLLAGDLTVAKTVLVGEQQIPGDLTPQDRLKELMLYSASEDYGRLRKLLGIAIRPE